MDTVNLVVEGMSCQHCVASVKNRLGALPGVENVDVSLESGKVKVVGNGIAAPFIIREIDTLGYKARLDA